MLRSIWFWGGVALLLAVLALLGWRQLGPLTVIAEQPRRGPAVEAVYATGTVEPTVLVPLGPRQSGRLVALLAEEGDAVRAGQILARLEDTDLNHSVAELEARARYARAQQQRTQELTRRGFSSKAELDRVGTERAAAEAALRRSQSQRDFLTLSSPHDGVIIRRDGEAGQFVPAGQTVFYLSCCAPLRVTADVDEEDINRVRVGQLALLRADALPGRVLQGTVSQITPKGDPVARSYRVRIQLQQPEGLRVGMTADANLVIAQREQALLIPSSAVLKPAATTTPPTQTPESTVWVVRDGQLRRQPVKTGVVGKGRTEILAGLDSNSWVVTTPNPQWQDGRAARVQTSPPSPPPAKP